MIRIAAVAMLLAAALSLTAGEKLPKPDRIPAPPTEKQTALIRDGIALHDRGDHPGAIEKYKQALAENPWEVTALHELSFTYFVAKER